MISCQQKTDEILKIYRRVSLLADKNNCKVLRLRHKELNTDLVLHILPKQNPAYKLLAEIKAESLPLIYDIFELSDGILVLEEYIDGLNLTEVLETGSITRRGVFKILRKVCDGLSVLHQNNIIHRDIKPENIMIDSNGRVVLIDFGAARKISVKSQDTEIIGTIGYVSPEQLGVKQTDQKTDIFALGILLNVLITGRHPSEQIAKGRVGRIVKKCTAISPADRYKNVKELKRALLF